MKCPPSPTNRVPSARRRGTSSCVHPAGVDEVADRQRPAPVANVLGQLIDQRGEPAVETDHQPVVAGARDRVHDLLDLRLVERQRLLHEHGLAGLERTTHPVGVRAVTGHHEHRFDRWVGEHVLGVGAHSLEAELALGVDRRQRAGGGRGGEHDAVVRGEVRQQHRRGVVPGADEADAEPAARGEPRARRAGRPRPRDLLGPGRLRRRAARRRGSAGGARSPRACPPGGGRRRRSPRRWDARWRPGSRRPAGRRPAGRGTTRGSGARSTGRSRRGSRCPPARSGRRSARARRTARTGRRAPSRNSRSRAGPAASSRCRRHDRGPGRAAPRPRPVRLDGPPAARKTWSQPSPSLASRATASTNDTPSAVGLAHASAPAFSARRHRASTPSRPTTFTPAATSSRTTSWPIRPSPMTQATSPS